MSNYIFNNQVSARPVNPNVGWNNSWIQVDNNADRPLYASASYITNFDGLTVSLTAGNVDIGAVHIEDPTSGLKVNVADVGAGLGALRVLSQDLESSLDDITIGDRTGNAFASVDRNLSALKVTIAEPNASYYSIDNFNLNGTSGFEFTDVERPIIALRVKPNQTRTILVDEYDIVNTDNSHICGYKWYVNPTLSVTPTWNDLTPQIQYAFLPKDPTVSTITGSLSTIKHSGVFSVKNSQADKLDVATLTGGSNPPILVLSLQHINGSSKSGAFITVNIKDLG